MKKEKTIVAMVRINSRILKSQSKFIKKRAKAFKLTEGDVLRAIITTFMDNPKYNVK